MESIEIQKTANMKISIPEEIMRLIEKYRTYGDGVSISKRLTKTEVNPEGDASRDFEITMAIKKGMGKYDVVKEIAIYYREKAKANDEINSL
jgi:hypothetical protein